MDVVLDVRGRAHLRDADNFRGFKAVVPGQTALGALSAANPALIRAVQGDDHLWLDVNEVARLGPNDEEWRSGFEKMIAYAQSKGWTRGNPLEVAAHVEAE